MKLKFFYIKLNKYKLGESKLEEWVKLGKIFCADQHSSWMHARAFVPTPILLNQEEIRVYCAFLDKQDIGRIGYVDVLASDPQKIVKISKDCVIEIGEKGTFDDSGLTPFCIIYRDNELILYYQGWQKTVQAPYLIFSGYAVSNDGGNSFQRKSQVPMLDRTEEEPILRSSPYVLPLPQKKYGMWYSGGNQFINIGDKLLPQYSLKFIKSDNPLKWDYPSIEILKPREDLTEFGLARPYVLFKNGIYHMWYSIRSADRVYRIGYAVSTDCEKWERVNDSVIPVSDTGWDSEMVAFPAVIETKYGIYMFYNGNGYGSTGFGVAKALNK